MEEEKKGLKIGVGVKGGKKIALIYVAYGVELIHSMIFLKMG